MAKSTPQSRAAARSRAQRQRTTLVTGVIVAALVFVVLILFLVSQLNTTANSAVPAAAANSPFAQIPQSTTLEGAPVLGSPTAKITIMEFADFSCPHCADYHSVMLQVVDNYVRTGKARLIFQVETFVGAQYSEIAAQGALCAGKQGRFWDMQGALFQLLKTRGATAYTIEQMKVMADQLGISGNEVKACIARGDTIPAIQSSYQLGESLGVNGTPAVLFSTDGSKTFSWLTGPDGQPMNRGGIPYEIVAQAIDRANG